jgi:hypothetical protein
MLISLRVQLVLTSPIVTLGEPIVLSICTNGHIAALDVGFDREGYKSSQQSIIYSKSRLYRI